MRNWKMSFSELKVTLLSKCYHLFSFYQMDFIKIIYNSSVINVPRCTSITVDEIVNLFGVTRIGIHSKVKVKSIYENIYPSSCDNFQFPNDTIEAFLVAHQAASATISSSITPLVSVTCAGDNSKIDTINNSYSFITPRSHFWLELCFTKFLCVKRGYIPILIIIISFCCIFRLYLRNIWLWLYRNSWGSLS